MQGELLEKNNDMTLAEGFWFFAWMKTKVTARPVNIGLFGAFAVLPSAQVVRQLMKNSRIHGASLCG